MRLSAADSSDRVTCPMLAQDRRGGSSAHTPSRGLSCSKTSPVTEDTNVLPKSVNVFQNRYNAAWPFRGEPSSDQAVPTAAEFS